MDGSDGGERRTFRGTDFERDGVAGFGEDSVGFVAAVRFRDLAEGDLVRIADLLRAVERFVTLVFDVDSEMARPRRRFCSGSFCWVWD